MRRLLGGFMALCALGVAAPWQKSAASLDEAWFAALATVPPGKILESSGLDLPLPLGIGSLSPMVCPFENMGFSPTAAGLNAWRRAVNVLDVGQAHVSSRPHLLLSNMPSLPDIDCIVVSSVHRPDAPTDYIYATLRSLFEELPAEANINIMVGNLDTQYLNADVLARAIGEPHLKRLRIIPPSGAVGAHLSGLGKVRRGSWNFARSLLAYTGQKGLLLLEDDVEIGHGSVARLSDVLRRHKIPLVSIFNNFCDKLPGRTVVVPGSPLEIHKSHASAETWYSQGLYVAADLVVELGRHQLLRMNDVYWDNLIRSFVNLRGLDMLYTFPSLLQHRGLISSGGWGAPESSCYWDDVEGGRSERPGQWVEEASGEGPLKR